MQRHPHAEALSGEGPSLATDPSNTATELSAICLMTAEGNIDIEAATSAAALCHPGLLVQALRAAQAAQWDPTDFSSSTSSDQAGSSAGLELLLVTCVLAACTCWSSARDSSLSKGADSTGNKASEVLHAAM